jgi:hypothetical protein
MEFVCDDRFKGVLEVSLDVVGDRACQKWVCEEMLDVSLPSFHFRVVLVTVNQNLRQCHFRITKASRNFKLSEN